MASIIYILLAIFLVGLTAAYPEESSEFEPELDFKRASKDGSFRTTKPQESFTAAPLAVPTVILDEQHTTENPGRRKITYSEIASEFVALARRIIPSPRKSYSSKNSLWTSTSKGGFITFRLSARALPRLVKSKEVDPYVVVFLADDKTKEPIKVGKTTYVLNNDNPVWSHSFTIPTWKFRNQRLHFLIYDKNFNSEDKFIGSTAVKVKNYVENGELLDLPLLVVGTTDVETGYVPVITMQSIES